MKKSNKKKIEEFIRVDHAGERGAIKIYEGQLLALNTLVKDDEMKKNLKNATIVVISSAIKKNNPEIIEAKKKKLPIITRGKMLAHIVSLMKNIVIAGSHGKTTTTSLVASIFQNSKIDPTIINGGVINSIKNSKIDISSEETTYYN